MDQQLLTDVVTVRTWVLRLNAGEFIEAPGYSRTYMSFRHQVSQQHLEKVCAVANQVLQAASSPVLVYDSMGEVIPSRNAGLMSPWMQQP